MSGVEIAMGVMAAASAVAGGVQQYQQGKAEKKVQDANADIMQKNAEQSRLESSINEDTLRSQQRQQISRMRAMMSEMGMADSTTSLGLLAQEESYAEQNANNLRYSSQTEANNFINNSNLASFYGNQSLKQGKNAFNMGLINGASSAIGSYYKYSTAKPAGK